MSARTHELDGERIFECASDGPKLCGETDATALIGDALAGGAETVVVPAERLDPAFFDLSTRVAGGMMQKFVNYRLRLVVMGDVAARTAASNALRDFVLETNEGDHVWFVEDRDALARRLADRKARG